MENRGQGTPGEDGFWLLLLNARSVNHKAPLICDLISEEQADLACVTETWLDLEGGIPLSEVCLAEFRVWHQPRLQGRGGGIAIVIWESLLASGALLDKLLVL